MISENKYLNIIGIDIEHYLDYQVAKKIENIIHTKLEKKLLNKNLIPSNIATTLAFSAKESLFKAIYPKTNCIFGFNTAKIVNICMSNNILKLRISNSFLDEDNCDKEYICNFEFKKNYLITKIAT